VPIKEREEVRPSMKKKAAKKKAKKK